MKKAQAALEYLMTYGWVFMVIFFTLSSLAYFGFLSPGSMLPKKCDISPGFSCVDHVVDVTANKNFVQVLFTNDYNTEIHFVAGGYVLRSEYWSIPLTDCYVADPDTGNPITSLGVYEEGEFICTFTDADVNFPGGDRVWFTMEGKYNAGLNTQDHKMFINVYGTTIKN